MATPPEATTTIMSLPVGTVIKLISQKAMVGSLGNLYGSIADLGDTYLQPGITKDAFLNPKMSAPSSDHVPLLMPAPPAAANPLDSKKVYLCGHCRSYARYSDDPTAKCPSCHNNMNLEPTYVAPPVKAQVSSAGGGEGGGGGGGFVRVYGDG
ncbi:unnamed protein product [Cuscuta campestris]|uniref:Uncharacterized protein n=1 Tax=Cuscuta campestris TaxID=132261 RepID=A0A484KLK0_9ASTE|nr:unnamed protein product [Cuscuta campestris]